MTTREKREEVKHGDGVTIVKGVAPKPGTKLTPKRITQNLRSLNRGWSGKVKKG